MEEGKKINYKPIAWILVTLFVILGYLYVQQYFKVRELEKYKRDNIENIKEIKLQAIQANKFHIDSLKQIIISKDGIIDVAKKREDSLLRVDKRIVYVYREKRAEIKEFNADKLEKYWRDEFSK